MLAASLYFPLKLKGAEWTDENKELFGFISVISISVPILLTGLKVLFKGIKEKMKLLLISGLTWILITLICSFLSMQYIQKANSGWTQESRLFYIEKCESLANEGKNYKCNCYVEQLIKIMLLQKFTIKPWRMSQVEKKKVCMKNGFTLSLW